MAPRGFGGGGRAHHRRPFGRRRLLQTPRHDTQVIELPEPPTMRDHRLGEPGVENIQSFVETLPVFFCSNTYLNQLLRHTAGAADLQPPAGQVVEHANLLQHAPVMVEGQHHAHSAEPQPRGGAGNGGDQQIGRRTVRGPEMMLTKEYTLEAKSFDVLPVGDGRLEERRGYLWCHIFARATGCVQELEDPRLDHALPLSRRLVKLLQLWVASTSVPAK